MLHWIACWLLRRKAGGAAAEAAASAGARDTAGCMLQATAADGSPGAEMVAEDHGSDLGAGGNHIRSVVRNELRPVVDRLLKISVLFVMGSMDKLTLLEILF